MGIFLLLWLLAIVIVFSVEIIAGIYWYSYIYNKVSLDTRGNLYFFAGDFGEKYINYLLLSYWWFIFIFALLFGIFIGWLIEKKFRFLSKVNIFWQKTQPEFYKNTTGEIRVFLPWLIIEFPFLIVSFINIFLLIFMELYLLRSISILIFVIGLISGQLIELQKEYKIIITLDRPEKPPTSVIQKFNPEFPSKYALFLGQVYCKILLPFFFLYIAVLIPGWLMIIPNYNNKNLIFILFLIISGITLRWFYDKKENFYFEKISLKNFVFLSSKLLILVSLILFSLILSNLYFLCFSSLFCGFMIPWHPEKLRQ